MAFCPNCGKELAEGVVFCDNCGASLNAAPQAVPAVAADPYDHTAEFSAEDVAQNKIYAMASYLLSAVGIIIALLAAPNSPYIAFHVRQVIKFTVVEMLLLLASALLAWTFIVPIVAGIALFVILIIEIIAFFQVCGGKSKEPAIIKSLSFLK